MFEPNEIVILNEHAAKDLPMRVGQRCVISDDYDFSPNYDYYGEFDDGEKIPLRSIEVYKPSEEDKQYMDFIFTNNQVMFDNKKVLITKANYLTKQADIFDDIGVFSIAEFKDLKPIHINSLVDDSRTTKHRKIIEEIHETFKIKNADYGNSFGEQYEEYGILSAVIRLDDKMRRLKQLMKQEAQVKDESIEDTLLDLANYSIMTVMELRK